MKLTEEQIADGWIEHDGGPCPVGGDTKVRLMFDSGVDGFVWVASKVIWPHDTFISEIGAVIPLDAQVHAYRTEPKQEG